MIKKFPVTATINALLRNNRRQSAMADMSAPMAKAAIFLDSWAQKNIKSEGARVGGWEPFKMGGRWISAAGQRKGYLDTSAKLLRDTGRAAASILPFHGKDDAGIFTNLDYLIAHHQGEGHLPERRVLPKRVEVIQDVRRILERHVERSIK